jgi:peptide/nickel transport system substrate-binding protein
MALTAAITASLLAVSGAGGAGAQTPKRGGTVVVAINSLAEPACLGWDPGCYGFYPQWREKVLALPFRVGPNGYSNDLVEGWSLTKSPFTVTFHIRPQARWSDGVRISAQDFVFAYETYLEHTNVHEDDPLRTAIRRVQPVDAKTVKFVFRARYGDWKELLNFAPLPRHALRGADLAASREFWRDGIVNPRRGEAIGSGPFHVGSFERGEQLVLVRNPNYWGRHRAYVDRILLRFVPGPDMEQALRSGNFDVGVLSPTPERLQSGYEYLAAPGGGWEHFEIRVRPGGHPALEDKRVRRALAFGIDRRALMRNLFGDAAGDRPPVLDSTVFFPSQRSFRPNWNIYRYRPAHSRQLLDQAGCSRGADGIYSCAGERLRLRFVTSAGAPAGARSIRERVLDLVGPQLRRAGFEVQPVFVPPSVLFGSSGSPLVTGEFDVALFSYIKRGPDDVDSPYRCPPDANASGYCSRLTEAELDQLDRIVDPARRAVVANRVDRRLASDVPALPLFQQHGTYVVRKGLHGVVPNPYSVLTCGSCVWNAENWWLAK